MALVDSSISAAEVLQAFHRDAPSLFLGAAFITVGVVAIGFSALRRQRDLLLIYFGIFAVVYGLRLWVQARLLGLLIPNSIFFGRLRSAISFLVPIPFVFYARSAGLLFSRLAVWVAYVLATVEAALVVATFAIGDRNLFEQTNTILVIVALLVLVAQSLRSSQRADEDFIVVRRGLLIFVVCALWDNLSNVRFAFGRLETFGFTVFLACLGYVAGKRTLQRDQQLSEIQKELDIARRIQLSILPGEFPRSPHFDVAVRYVPMTSVAGDFYEYVIAEGGIAGLLIADVSGHGVPAALIASMVKLAAASQRSTASDPSRFLLGMNEALHGNTQSQFVTAAYVYLDSHARELRYSAAAHPPMLMLRGGQVMEIEENGLMLAAFDFATYTNALRDLQTGDRLLLYTDGVIEAANTGSEFFGKERLSELLRSTHGASAREAADSILSSVQKWSATQDDDLTMIVCDFLHESPDRRINA